MSSVPLGRMLRAVSPVSPRADRPISDETAPISGVEHDSRQVKAGGIFVCLKGGSRDGHDFAAEAAARGAVLVVGERERLPEDFYPSTRPAALHPQDAGTSWAAGAGSAPRGSDASSGRATVPYVRVTDSRKALALLACEFCGHPSRDLRLIAGTGTNGKSSFTWMCDAILRAAGLSSAVLGTLGSGPTARLKAAVHTTPEANDLQRELAAWRDQGIQAGAIEVSSHGLALRRSYNTRFACVAFTNLTPDHLDFHGSMEAYRDAKALLFEKEERGPEEPAIFAVVNADDPATLEILARSSDRVLSFGRGADADVHPTQLEIGPEGIRMQVAFRPGGWDAGHEIDAGSEIGAGRAGPGESTGEAPRFPFESGTTAIVSPLLGSFQVDNLLAAFATGIVLGIRPETAARGLASLAGIPGRMERVDRGGGIPVLVDYAHTPDALRRALEGLRPFTSGRIILVFGCGGDRDRAKRAPMGEAAAAGADWIVLTDDNPRTEDPAAIRAQARQGLEVRGARFMEEGDRERAIRAAISEARSGDLVLIAGKGHETVQIRGHEALPFDDRETARRILEERSMPERRS